MTTLTIKIPEGMAADVSDFVKKIGGEVIETTIEKSSLYNQTKRSVNEVNNIKEGKLKGIPAKDLLRDLQG